MMRTSNDGRFRRPVGSRVSLRALSALIVAAAFFVLVFFFRHQAAGLLLRGSTPLNGAQNQAAAGAGGFFSWFASKSALEAQNSTLHAELLQAQAELADRDALYADNLLLKKELGRPDAAPAAVLAGVIVRPPGTPYDTLLIDAGTNQGVAAGMPVSAGGTAVIGTVDEAYAAASRVSLFSSPGKTYQALLKGTIPLTIDGRGGGSFSGKVPASTAVEAGDALILQGVVGAFAGTVSAVETPEGDSFKTLYFNLAVNPSTIRYVEIWKQ